VVKSSINLTGFVTHVSQLEKVHEVFIDNHKGSGYLASQGVYVEG
jgi:hypothetical protein